MNVQGLAWALWLVAAPGNGAERPVAFVDVAVEVGDGTRLPRATVVVQGDVITAVGPDVRVPAGAVQIAGAGRVLSPGLIEVGSQLGLFEVGLESAIGDSTLEGSLTPAFRAGDGFHPLSPRIPVAREEGVTTAVLAPDLSSQQQLLAGQGFVVELASRLDVVPDLQRPVGMFGVYNGTVASSFGGARGGVLLALREIVDDARSYRKDQAAYDNGQRNRPLRLGRLHLQALFPVLDGTVPLVLRVDRASDILAVLAVCARERLRLVIDGGAESWLVADQLRQAGVPVVVRPSEAGQLSFDAFFARDDLATVLHEAGVTVVIGTWGSENGTSRLRQEAGIAVQSGLPHEVAVQAITSTPARVFGGGAAVGVVRAGARANLVLWSGDPLEVLTIAERVFVAGQEMTTPSRQRQLAARYKK